MVHKDISVFYPDNSHSNEYFIDDTFKREILLHFSKNRIKSINAPLILSIQGKKGEGKTSHVLKICQELGIVVVFLHGSSISGQHEREPADLIKTAYLEANNYYKMGKQALLFIDDIDTSVAATIEDRRYTVNSQIVNGTFMSIADNPTLIGEIVTERIPIIFTGNDLTNLYSPLRRNGRMKVFSWEPDQVTKTKIINFIFQNQVEKNEFEKFQKLIRDHIDKPLSFFTDIKNELFDDYILTIINRNGKVNFSQIDFELSSIVNSYISLETIRKKVDMLSNAILRNYN